ncbi:MAG: AbgT family transporter [Anaerolineales bacterium]|nr:AbgT family transporter [Anaerolineales bacterium]
MNEKAGAQISRRAFIQSAVILLAMMLVAGVLTLVLPAGEYQRTLSEGRQVIDPQSYRQVEQPNYPFWRWFLAPLEVLTGPDRLTLIVIIIFILMVGSGFAVLDKCGILQAGLGRLIGRFQNRKYLLLALISLFFMSLGAFFGIFEEVVPLVPLMLALSYLLGWDSLVGLGMSILATNIGFSAAITNPFTIGVAQRIAELPAFSGAGFRAVVFLAMYGIFLFFLLRYAKKIEQKPETSLTYREDQHCRTRFHSLDIEQLKATAPKLGTAMAVFGVFLILILLVLVSAPFVPALSDFSLPLVGLLFLVGAVTAGLSSGAGGKTVWAALGEGMGGIAPGIPLILMAASVKFIVAQGKVMDTILYQASRSLGNLSPFEAALWVYGLALLLEFFIASGSAKALLVMPILLPLADLLGVTRQVTVTAYCFGDGFSNLAYPTNPVLLICLGLTVVSYPRWMRWTAPLWLGIIIASVAFLGLAVAIGLGPF